MGKLLSEINKIQNILGIQLSESITQETIDRIINVLTKNNFYTKSVKNNLDKIV